MDSFTVSSRFCGPPDSGNGGYTCGMVARALGGVMECTLRAPVPLNASLRLEPAQSGGILRHGDKTIIEAASTALHIAPPPPLDVQAAARAMSASPALDPKHPFPTCFVCGPERKAHDGLHIFPAPVDGGFHVATWVPDAEFGDGERLLRPEILWAALDCPTGFAAGFPLAGKLVTGRMAVEQLKPVRTGTICLIMAWPLAIEGRKHFSAACLYQDNEPRAVAKATWIKIGD